MKLLLYARGNDGTVHRLQSAIADVAPPDGVEVCTTVVGLQKALQRGTSDVAAIVLCACSSDDLRDILSMGDWFLDLRTILLLPDREVSTFTQGLTLRPRFISYLDTDLSDVSAVVAKMVAVYREQSMACRFQTAESQN
ncbi:MAG: hypothetical protein AB9873_14470 [Syntrophobacteraceae bacterium]